MMAFISDIHGNLEALKAVLADIAEHKVEEIYCLGDTIGYGPNPRECMEKIMEVCKVTLLGNHDQAALFDPNNFNEKAERAIQWTREQLEFPVPSPAARERRWEFLAEMPRRYQLGKCLLVHGSPRNPVNEYIFPEDVYNERKMDAIFRQVDQYCFQGHTHVPGIFTENRTFVSPEETENVWQLDDRKVLCNVGSVGQPRDGDPRACYILIDDQTIRFRRIEYDLETTVKKIQKIPDLDNFLAERLRQGR